MAADDNASAELTGCVSGLLRVSDMNHHYLLVGVHIFHMHPGKVSRYQYLSSGTETLIPFCLFVGKYRILYSSMNRKTLIEGKFAA
jgi:hypothetical protein